VRSSLAVLLRTLSLQTVFLLGTATALKAPEGEVAVAAHQVAQP
jgi:hypothetical protein